MLHQFRIRNVTLEKEYQNYGQMSTKQAYKISFKNIHALLYNYVLGVWLFF